MKLVAVMKAQSIGLNRDGKMSDVESSDAPTWLTRQQQLVEQGLSQSRAFTLASLEDRIAQWPPEWGDELRVQIFGDFFAPKDELVYSTLGIRVLPEVRKDSAIRSALTVLDAFVKVSSKDIDGVRDASRRLDQLIGIASVANLGNQRFGWWCWMTDAGGGGVGTVLDHEDIPKAIEQLNRYPPAFARRIMDALRWVSDARVLMLERDRMESVRVFEYWWNAFECLVEAINILQPPTKISDEKKEAMLSQILERHGGVPSISCAIEMKRVLDTGFRDRATHALRTVFAAEANLYLLDLFEVKPKEERLYSIRNAIKHASVDYSDHLAMARVDDRSRRLWFIIWRLFAILLGTFHPLDPEAVKFREGT